MAPTPLSASYRLVFYYTVDGLQHKLQLFLKTTASADPSGYNTVPRSGKAAVGVSTVMDPVWTAMAPMFSTTLTTFDKCELQHLVSDEWVILYTATTTVVPSTAITYKKAWQYCFFAKTTTNKRVPTTVFEGVYGVADLQRTRAAMFGYGNEWVDRFYNASSDALDADPWSWMVGRDNNYLNVWLSIVTDTNEKLRRMRGIK